WVCRGRGGEFEATEVQRAWGDGVVAKERKKMRLAPSSRRKRGSRTKAMRSRGDVVDLAEWLQQKVQADLDHRVKDGDGVERLRANRAIVALRRVSRRIERSMWSDTE